MPCYKDLCWAPVPGGFIRGSHHIPQRGARGASNPPDFRTFDPSHTVGLAKEQELRHAEVLRRSAERHLQRNGHTLPTMLRGDAGLEESRYIRRLHPDAGLVSQVTLGRSRSCASVAFG
mmetsp:Transcript_5859/g.14881  ORF Transcript_5859/g.14881 Transcript_5859/m.14881 type:complete len:119 (-) Transcript_5859:7-363(-)